MSIGPAGFIGSFAGTPMSQSQGSDVDRAKSDRANQQRQVSSEQQAEKAAGIGATDEDQAAEDRDADGRRLWEIDEQASSEQDSAEEEAPSKQRRDASGSSGSHLDLSG